MPARKSFRLKRRTPIKSLLNDAGGAAMVEYAVILAVVVLVGGGALGAVGATVGSTFSRVADEISELAKQGRGKGPGDTPCGTAAKDPNKFC